MTKRMVFSALVMGACIGASCEISFPDDDNDLPPSYVQLDRATAELRITSSVADSSAGVTASIRRNANAVVLQGGQDVSVNGRSLPELGLDNLYSLTVPRAATYVVRVEEPTLGIHETTLATPADFSITAPAAGASVSLAEGFQLTWSEPNPAVSVRVVLSQSLNNAVKVLGPFDQDTGSLTVTSDDLMPFRQGSPISIVLTKSARTEAIEGFASAAATVELSQTISVVPAP